MCWTVVVRLSHNAKTALLQADAILGANLLIAAKLRETDSLDHRALLG